MAEQKRLYLNMSWPFSFRAFGESVMEDVAQIVTVSLGKVLGYHLRIILVL